ncbi:hypothetical protein BDZ89DRAFT_973611 [Hymenopellis radicata]|nr:hypothetical protein BDZ89DRAFT_973611 [Hymenopellis radicata]
MDRFECSGWLRVTVNNDNASIARIRLTHHHAHTPYLDINLGPKEKSLIDELKHLAPSKIWDKILAENPDNEFTEKQVYREWTRLNEKEWRLDDDQVKSAEKLIKSVEDYTTMVIPITPRPGIHAIAFALKEPLDAIGDEIVEVAMDSTWKTNAAGYELYSLVAELNGCAIPIAFLFTTSDGTAPEGSKDLLLQDFLNFIAKHCPNIKFTDSDKETSEISAFGVKMPNAKHQLCYWHSIRYIEKRLGEDKPPAAYDPRRANKIFDFIDPTWAPGITSGLIEEGVHPDHIDAPVSSEPLKIHINLRRMENVVQTKPTESAPAKTCLPPLMILKSGDMRTPIYPAPPTTRNQDLPVFCPKEHRKAIIEKFRVHLHQHPSIPLNDAAGTLLTADEIH